MKISFKGDYALKACLELALHWQGPLVTIAGLATRLDIPRKFLEQVLLDLKAGGFVDSVRGKAGGYFLSRPPESIRVGDVVRFIDGPVEPIACVNDCYEGCKEMPTCVLRGVWQRAAAATAAVVDGVTLAELVREARAKSGTLHFDI